jgi:hypothetical protein
MQYAGKMLEDPHGGHPLLCKHLVCLISRDKRYFQAPSKLLASSWLPYNGRIMWQLGVPIWETQEAGRSSDDLLIRLFLNLSVTMFFFKHLVLLKVSGALNLPPSDGQKLWE